MTNTDVVVVGGGLAGLAAATLLARAGRRVVLLEGSELGGRARSREQDGFTFNMGPHALYRRGAAKALLDELGVPVRGASPPTRGLGLLGDRLEALPFEPWSAVSTALVSPVDRWQLARWLAGVVVQDAAALRGRSVADWLAPLPPGAAGVAAALVRVSTYAADHHRLDAGAAALQVQRALRSVLYLDGGWQGLVDGLRRAALEAGVDLHTRAAVRSVEDGVVRTDAASWRAPDVLLCVGPEVAARLTGSPALGRIAEGAVPVLAACLDLGIRGRVDPLRRFALGIDRPLYVSVHSEVAALAPVDGSLIHAAVYGAEGEPGALRAELEALVDRLVPGWRDRVVVERWMPKWIVAHDLPRAACGGERAPIAVADRPGVWVAGDWVGDEGMLADAAAASARAASRAILAARVAEAA